MSGINITSLCKKRQWWSASSPVVMACIIVYEQLRWEYVGAPDVIEPFLFCRRKLGRCPELAGSIPGEGNFSQEISGKYALLFHDGDSKA